MCEYLLPKKQYHFATIVFITFWFNKKRILRWAAVLLICYLLELDCQRLQDLAQSEKPYQAGWAKLPQIDPTLLKICKAKAKA